MNSPFTEAYRAAVENMLRPLTPDDGMSGERLDDAEARLSLRMPQSVRDYYLLLGNFREVARAHHRLLAPEDWFQDKNDPTRVVFMEENQNVMFWGVEASLNSNDDAPVYVAWNPGDGPIEWYDENVSVGKFLHLITYMQIAFGGSEYIGTAQLKPDTLVPIVTQWQSLGNSNDLSVYVRDNQVVCVIGNGAVCNVYFAAQTEELFSELVDEMEGVGIDIDML